MPCCNTYMSTAALHAIVAIPCLPQHQTQARQAYQKSVCACRVAAKSSRRSHSPTCRASGSRQRVRALQADQMLKRRHRFCHKAASGEGRVGALGGQLGLSSCRNRSRRSVKPQGALVAVPGLLEGRSSPRRWRRGGSRNSRQGPMGRGRCCTEDVGDGWLHRPDPEEKWPHARSQLLRSAGS